MTLLGSAGFQNDGKLPKRINSRFAYSQEPGPWSQVSVMKCRVWLASIDRFKYGHCDLIRPYASVVQLWPLKGICGAKRA